MSGSAKPTLTKLGGDGPAVVLLHGYGSDRQSWLATAPALFELLSVWVMDLPAHGQSAPDCGNGSITALADTVLDAANAAALDTFHIMGHSLGGRIGLQLCADIPERVQSLVLIAPAGLGLQINETFLRQFAAADDIDSLHSLLLTLVHDPKMIGRTLAKTVLQHLEKPGVRGSLQLIANGLLDAQSAMPETLQAVQNANLKRMVLWGDSDTINPLNAEAASAFGGKLHVLDNCGHLPHIESRLKTNQLLVDFYSKACRRSQV